VLRSVNAGEFLGAGPELLLCSGAWVEKVSGTAAIPGREVLRVTEAMRQFKWLVCYHLIEHAAQTWNELYHETEGGKLVRRRHDLADVVDMGAFFGASEFPLTQGDVTP
jgi:hypothetical protein